MDYSGPFLTYPPPSNLMILGSQRSVSYGRCLQLVDLSQGHCRQDCRSSMAQSRFPSFEHARGLEQLSLYASHDALEDPCRERDDRLHFD